jgi:hypothetical protein
VPDTNGTSSINGMNGNMRSVTVGIKKLGYFFGENQHTSQNPNNEDYFEFVKRLSIEEMGIKGLESMDMGKTRLIFFL